MKYPARADGVPCHTLHATGGGQSKRIVEATKRSPHLVACRSNRSAGLRGANSETGHGAGLFVSIRSGGIRRCIQRLNGLPPWAGCRPASLAPFRRHTYPGCRAASKDRRIEPQALRLSLGMHNPIRGMCCRGKASPRESGRRLPTLSCLVAAKATIAAVARLGDAP
jgi:hypothetical protein